KFLYSNIGAGLLGQLLVARAGLPSYEELLTTRIAGPLGMRDTRVSWTADSWSRAAHQRGPRASGSPSGYVLLGGGAGGIKSTVDDLLKFEGAYLGFQKTGFGPALNMTLERRYARDTGESVGLLWNLDPRENLVSKDGKVNGHLAFLLFSRQKQAGVVICTTVGAKTRLKLLARKLLALLDSRPASAVAPANGSGPEEDSDDED
ncbi:MAG: beta-lactamase family protein, partial [Deltaproteobacteria bacterium]|nr:beta-lactamase family protein [Deltaproteobacteria bacterium]